MSQETVIVSRHPGAIEWLRQQGITGNVIERATVEDVKDNHVIGNLPLSLAAEAISVTMIEMPNQPRDARGTDLTPEQMNEYGAQLIVYMVRKVPSRGDAAILWFYE